jgi:hypothetical protein
MKRILLALTAMTLLGCQQAPEPQVLAPISFANMPQIRLAVSEIHVVEQYQPPLRTPNVEHMFPTPPAAAVKQWANDRLKASGTQGLMEITIEDASVKEIELPKTKGLRGLFTDDQSERYDAKLRVTMRVYDGEHTIAMAEGDVNVIRSRSINEKATINDRERLFNDLTKELMMQFNTEAEARLRQYFATLLR